MPCPQKCQFLEIKRRLLHGKWGFKAVSEVREGVEPLIEMEDILAPKNEGWPQEQTQFFTGAEGILFNFLLVGPPSLTPPPLYSK